MIYTLPEELLMLSPQLEDTSQGEPKGCIWESLVAMMRTGEYCIHICINATSTDTWTGTEEREDRGWTFV